jgi:glyoxylase-like metal-dependent hydrolase (beta-lactamase superfamily II)
MTSRSGTVGRVEAAPGNAEIVRLIAPNLGPLTLEGTNTYVIARDPALVIDPGPANPEHLARIRETARPRGGIGGVLLTHSHLDHSEAAKDLDAPLLWGEIGSGDESSWVPSPRPPSAAPEHVGPVHLIATPGHAADHVCFVWKRACFCGDLILGRGSSIVPPAALGGSLPDYMASLRRVAELDVDLLCPGHGPWITEPGARAADYIEHRLERERRLVAALAAGERSRTRLLDEVWDDVPDVLRPAAAFAMQAHLEKLEAEGRLPASLRD